MAEAFAAPAAKSWCGYVLAWSHCIWSGFCTGVEAYCSSYDCVDHLELPYCVWLALGLACIAVLSRGGLHSHPFPPAGMDATRAPPAVVLWCLMEHCSHFLRGLSRLSYMTMCTRVAKIAVMSQVRMWQPDVLKRCSTISMLMTVGSIRFCKGLW